MKTFPLLGTLIAGLGAVLATARGAEAHQLLQVMHSDGGMTTGDDSGSRLRVQQRRGEETHVRREAYAGQRFLNQASTKFLVNGSAIPGVDFDIGESYAGLLPISDKADERDSLFFWFFPTASEEKREEKEIVIWLNGGPGCSSLLGLLQENGPFQWQPGTLKPERNPWSWHLLSNVVYIEQPVTTGYSQGKATARNEDDVARQFLGFWSNFIKTFGMSGWRVYIAAESYGGYYGPYIASHMIDAKDDKRHGKMSGLMVYDGIMFDGVIQVGVVMEAFIDQHRDLMPLDDATMRSIRNVSASCGYQDWHKRYLRYPAVPGPLPPFPGSQTLKNGTVTLRPECQNIFNQIYEAIRIINPCFNIYNIRDSCPKVRDVLSQEEKQPYFQREDVKRAIHAPLEANWKQCADGVFVSAKNGVDESPPPDAYHLPNVVDHTHNVIIAHGAMDFILPLNGVLLGLQNMTWGGKRGFERAPADPFYVPLYGFNSTQGAHYYGDQLPAGAGVQGTVHEERGLTLVVTQLAGHEGPGYAPAAALRHLEKLLGRVDSLSKKGSFTLPVLKKATQVAGDLGKGTVKIPCLGAGC
ncbi:hypothetical protein XA68_12446 [Ophiocordyceps unilateralis]|uniref:Carboxypeptidase n=1 Tax=Ophiocordyceps unilateralis TaxID=268505 RepID=A0A2A9PES2_OPHUN|nr:hypothetical protein XA68_12446 [Ophiocordyceps unilateralis]